MKETKVVQPERKKVRTETGRISSSKHPMVQLDVVGLTREALEYEENEATSRQTNYDTVIFGKTCNDIRNLMKEMKSATPEKLEENKNKVCMAMLDLKRLNRYDKLRNKAVRDSVFQAKQKVDTYHLQLENLLYETMCLQKEITKCREFKSKVDDVQLVPLQQFAQEAPSELVSAVAEEDEHKTALARLEWELKQRKQLADTLKSSDQEKTFAESEVEKTKAAIDKLHPKLKNVVDVVHSTQEAIESKKDEN
jgi:THO complex subunit 5